MPILGYLSFTVVFFVSLFRGNVLGPELAAIFAIFTSKAWNMAFSFYRSLKTIPISLDEASHSFRSSVWQRFWRLEVPFAMPGLIWNMMMSMSGGWFFVVAAEAISVGNLQIALPGVGSYVATAIQQRSLAAVGWAILAMTIAIVLYDQLLFRPMVARADKFRAEDTAAQTVPSSWVLNLFRRSKSAARLAGDALSWHDCSIAATNGGLTLLRVAFLVALASLIWVPIGVAVGLRPKLTAHVQPVAQFLAAFPANLLFPVFVYFIVRFQLAPSIWLVPLMILGTQWYILFNVIAGASAFPSDLREAATCFRVRPWRWWQDVMLPGIFPYYVTGAITASGGAWNASIGSEVVSWGPTRLSAGGLGAYIAQML